MEFNFAHNSDELMNMVNWIVELNFYRHINDDGSAELRWKEGTVHLTDAMMYKNLCKFLKEDAEIILEVAVDDNTLDYKEYSRQYDLVMTSIYCINVIERWIGEMIRRAFAHAEVSSFNVGELKDPK